MRAVLGNELNEMCMHLYSSLSGLFFFFALLEMYVKSVSVKSYKMR